MNPVWILWRLVPTSGQLRSTSPSTIASTSRMLRERTPAVLHSSGWVTCSSTFVSTLLQQDALNMSSELTLLTACQRWARHQVDNTTLREAMSAFLPHLRLRSLTAEQFAVFSLEDEIFTAEESRRCLVKPELEMPAGLCDVNTPRRALTELCGEKQDLLTVLESLVEDKVNPMSTSNVDLFDRITNNNKYEESLTLQLWDNDENSALLSSLIYDATLSYVSKAGEGDVMLFLPKPLKPETSVHLQVNYHAEVKGQRQVFGFLSDNLPWVKQQDLLLGNGDGVYNISAVLYKQK